MNGVEYNSNKVSETIVLLKKAQSCFDSDISKTMKNAVSTMSNARGASSIVPNFNGISSRANDYVNSLVDLISKIESKSLNIEQYSNDSTAGSNSIEEYKTDDSMYSTNLKVDPNSREDVSWDEPIPTNIVSREDVSWDASISIEPVEPVYEPVEEPPLYEPIISDPIYEEQVVINNSNSSNDTLKVIGGIAATAGVVAGGIAAKKIIDKKDNEEYEKGYCEPSGVAETTNDDGDNIVPYDNPNFEKPLNNDDTNHEDSEEDYYVKY